MRKHFNTKGHPFSKWWEKLKTTDNHSTSNHTTANPGTQQTRTIN